MGGKSERSPESKNLREGDGPSQKGYDLLGYPPHKKEDQGVPWLRTMCGKRRWERPTASCGWIIGRGKKRSSNHLKKCKWRASLSDAALPKSPDPFHGPHMEKSVRSMHSKGLVLSSLKGHSWEKEGSRKKSKIISEIPGVEAERHIRLKKHHEKKIHPTKEIQATRSTKGENPIELGPPQSPGCRHKHVSSSTCADRLKRDKSEKNFFPLPEETKETPRQGGRGKKTFLWGGTHI